MRPGDVFVSSAGSLHAQYIVHIVSPEWSGGRKKEEKILSETVFKALREANKKNIKSIAIPAIGCGNYGFPLQNSTKAIANSINNFFREIQDSPIQTVYLQDVKPETVTAFTSAIEDVFQDVDIVAHSEDEDDDEMNYEFSVFKKSLSSKGAVQRRSGE